MTALFFPLTLAVRGSAAPYSCLLDGTLFSPNASTSLSLKTGLGPLARVRNDGGGFFYEIPFSTEACAQTDCINAPGHRCLEDPTSKGQCAWPDLATATEECSAWDDCAAFTCNTTSVARKSRFQCYARCEKDVYPDGAAHKQSQGSYDPVDGSPVKRVSQEDHTLYLKGAKAAYTIEMGSNCGETACSWSWAAGTVSHNGAGVPFMLLTTSDGRWLRGSLSADCSSINVTEVVAEEGGSVGGDTSVWTNVNLLISKVHVVYMAHLDVGYTVTSINDNINAYIQRFFPASFATSDAMRNGTDKFVWTTHPWVIDMIQRNVTGATTPEFLAAMERAIRLGDLVWHHNAMNFQARRAPPLRTSSRHCRLRPPAVPPCPPPVDSPRRASAATWSTA